MRVLALLALAALAGCDGTAPPVGPAPALGIETPCAGINTPPPGYTGPISPHAGPCPQVWTSVPKPTGVFDYSQGAPPRAVRGQ